jgi:aldehyde:ferredoxin oxidoreductase
VLHKEWHETPLEEHIGDPECLVPAAGGQTATRIGARIDMGEFLAERERYYTLREWDPATGLQRRAHLESLGLPEVAQGLAEKGLLAGEPG